jgi:transposase
MLTSARDNADGMKSEAAFAHLCGAAVPANSGRTDRDRLNRGGDRSINKAPTSSSLAAFDTRHAPAPTSSDGWAKALQTRNHRML